MTKKLTLISFDLCPYVQRAAIVLAEKRVPFERVNIDLSNKPDWFLAISPLGKVPVLKVGDDVLFESSVIAEYLDETEAPPLHPADPLIKAKHRAWMEFGSSLLGDLWVVQTTKDEAALAAKIPALKDKLARVEAELGDGPFFAGANFSIVDAVFAPVFRILDVVEDIRPLGVVEGLPKVALWRKALAARPSVIGAVPADYKPLLRAMLKKQGGVIAAELAEAA